MPGLRGAGGAASSGGMRRRQGIGVQGTGVRGGPPCWVDAQLPDVEAGRRFYGELFGWTFEEQPRGTVRALKDGEGVASLAHKTDGRLPTVWTVTSPPPTPRRCAGGSARPAADRLRAAALRRPRRHRARHRRGGCRVLPLAGRADPGFGRRHEPGAFAWAQLYTRDTEAANTFYGDLFHDALFGPDADPDFGRAPVSDVFAPEMPPHSWSTSAVEDLAAGLAEVSPARRPGPGPALRDVLRDGGRRHRQSGGASLRAAAPLSRFPPRGRM